MAPKNGMMAKIEAKYNTYYENLFRARINMLTQICQDAACFAANDVFKMGQGRAVPFCIAFREYVNEIARLMREDQKSDADFVYAKQKIDDRLRAIVGEENFAPWDERHGT